MNSKLEASQNYLLDENETALGMAQKSQRKGSTRIPIESFNDKNHIEKIAKLNKAYQIKQGFNLEKTL